jgi:GNAT superfamily N-acetyltransferase
VKIREAVPADAEAIAWVHVESWKTTYAGIVPQDYLDSLNVADRAAQWERHVAEGVAAIFVAEDEGGVFGFAAGGRSLHPVADYDGELYAIYLLASHQGKCAGAALVRETAGGIVAARFPEHGGLGAQGESRVRVLSAAGRGAGG